MADEYDIGDSVILSLLFTINGAATDPTGATCTVEEPDGTQVVVVVSKVSTGVYEGTFSPTKSGDHWWRGVGTGTAACAGEGYFSIRKRQVG